MNECDIAYRRIVLLENVSNGWNGELVVRLLKGDDQIFGVQEVASSNVNTQAFLLPGLFPEQRNFVRLKPLREQLSDYVIRCLPDFIGKFEDTSEKPIVSLEKFP